MIILFVLGINLAAHCLHFPTLDRVSTAEVAATSPALLRNVVIAHPDMP